MGGRRVPPPQIDLSESESGLRSGIQPTLVPQAGPVCTAQCCPGGAWQPPCGLLVLWARGYVSHDSAPTALHPAIMAGSLLLSQLNLGPGRQSNGCQGAGQAACARGCPAAPHPRPPPAPTHSPIPDLPAGPAAPHQGPHGHPGSSLRHPHFWSSRPPPTPRPPAPRPRPGPLGGGGSHHLPAMGSLHGPHSFSLRSMNPCTSVPTPAL